MKYVYDLPSSMKHSGVYVVNSGETSAAAATTNTNSNANNENNANISIKVDDNRNSSCLTCSKKRLFIAISVTLMVVVIVAVATALLVYFLVTQNTRNKATNTTTTISTTNSTTFKQPSNAQQFSSLTSITTVLSTSSTRPVTNNLLARSCGVPATTPRWSRIVGGYEATPHSWPYVVSIGFFGPSKSLYHVCGGTLINNRYVLTASHCVMEATIYKLVGNPIPTNPKYANMKSMMRLFIGVHSIPVDDNVNTTYYAEEVTAHLDYEEVTFTNDIALIRLTQNVVENDHVKCICTFNNVTANPGENVYTIGWGYTSGGSGRTSDALQQVQVPVYTERDCPLSVVMPKQFCAGSASPVKDSCDGDSGGPVMKLINNLWTIVGIVSSGDPECRGSGLYTYIPYYYDWILNHLKP